MGNSPAQILQKANSLLCEGNNEQMFVTAWVGIVDFETGVMTCANAGHEYPVIRTAGKYELFKDKHDFVLGGMDGVSYREYELKLSEGERIIVYTDGVPEADNESGEQFGTERMLETLNENSALNLSVSDTLINLRKSIYKFCGNADQFDDVTMLCFEFDKRMNNQHFNNE
jgi:sigma-B regulation protein RsbU (phosphoserine phosphatase)